jgi:hypothetical protein
MVEHVSANAPGRIEGSREHTYLAVMRTRDDRGALFGHTGEAHLDCGQTRRQRWSSSPHDGRTPRSWQTRRQRRAPSRRGANHRHRASGSSPRTCRALREIHAENHQIATLEAGDARGRATTGTRPSDALRTRRGRPCTRSREASEHGRRTRCARDAEGRARGRVRRASAVTEHTDLSDGRARLRECARQDRGEPRAHVPRGHAHTRPPR